MEAALGPLLCLQSMPLGGGRGVFAKDDVGIIRPGTLLCREQALITMPTDRQEQVSVQTGTWASWQLYQRYSRSLRTLSALPIFELEPILVDILLVGAMLLLAATAPLHPTTLADLQPDMLSELRAQHQQDVASLQALLEGGASAASADSVGPNQPLTADSLLRLMLVLRFNAHYRWGF
eukprot:1150511-Pelagomonas_calceolata.AAC.1